MHLRTPLALALALALGPISAFAADDLQQLHQEIEALRQSYESRLSDLEARLKQAEARTEAAQNAVAQQAATPPAAEAPVADGPAAAANTFNPAISLVLSGLYANLSHDPADYRISGFIPGGEIGPGQRGFSLAESELGVYANVDPWFYGGLNFAIHPDDTASAEEAFLQTTALPDGVRIKFGRFFSGIGYLNEQHAHTWDFVDAPLAYQAFLGGQMGDDGVQVKWLLPTDQFLELGAEAGRGRNFPGSDRDQNGLGSATLFAHTGGDIGDSHSWSAGLSWLSTSPRDRQYDDTDLFATPVTNSFDGRSRLWLADFVWKWAPHGNGERVNFKLQGEYFHRNESGDLTYDVNSDSTGSHTDRYRSAQSGGYLQGIYQFMPAWRVGLRYDRLDSGSVNLASNAGNLANSDYKPSKYSLMVDWTPSEFSRVRLQFAQDKSQQGITDNQMFLQYQMSLGAHGAHIF
ncbi:MAG: TonB-dependent receptor [Gallionellaceae bacterium]|nr:TonB-dependent receptor [Gallionellaceae bacterium]